MDQVTHPVYKDYPEQPYISPDRDLAQWEKDPERFPYGKVEKRQMQRLAEGILPGHVIMLWRIHFNNFTTETVIPQYFEYRYGVESKECIQTLLDLGYIILCNATDSLTLLTSERLKKILKQAGLSANGTKAALLRRALKQFSEIELAGQFLMRRYEITKDGTRVLVKYGDIVRRHGPKM